MNSNVIAFPNQFSMIHRWSACGGSTIVKTTSDWEAELAGWLEPFLESLGHKARRRAARILRPQRQLISSSTTFNAGGTVATGTVGTIGAGTTAGATTTRVAAVGTEPWRDPLRVSLA